MSYNKTKCDPSLGQEIHKYLVKKGVETPGVGSIDLSEGRKERIDAMEGHFASIMGLLGLDLSDDSLMDTPKRVAKMFLNEIFWGLDINAFPKCTAVDNKMKYDEMVIEKNINIQSNCEHHLVVIDGLATVAYIPNEKVLGLSKLNRICEYFAKRPQIQERLTEQVFYALEYILGTSNIAVLVDAQHYCVKSRGVEDTGSSTLTIKLGGVFKENPAARAEFMGMVDKKN